MNTQAMSDASRVLNAVILGVGLATGTSKEPHFTIATSDSRPPRLSEYRDLCSLMMQNNASHEDWLLSHEELAAGVNCPRPASVPAASEVVPRDRTAFCAGALRWRHQIAPRTDRPDARNVLRLSFYPASAFQVKIQQFSRTHSSRVHLTP